MISASKTLKKNLSIAVATVFLAVAAFACWAIEPSKAYANTTDSHLTVASEVHVLVDSEGNVTIPNATVTNDGTCAAYIMGCSSPDGLGWTCDAVGKRIEVGQSITATWRSAGPVSDEIAAQLGEEPYYAGNLTYTYTDGDLKGTVSLDNTDPTVGDTITATVTGANVPDDKLTYQWVKVKDGSETSIDGATGSTYTATDDDAGYELVCKVSSTDDICQGTISGATGAVKKILAFAVYSADDGSLSFYKRAEVPKQGSMYLGKRATAVYTGLENMTSIPGWMLNYSKDIKTAIVYDEGISPIGTGHWFAELRNMKTAEVSKLDMSKCQTISCMFSDCTSLETLDLSAWDTRSLTDMNQAFQNCTSLTKLNVSGWDVSKVTNMTLSFAEDRTLSSLDLSTWDNSAVTSMKDVFSMMDSLNEVSLGSKFKFVGTNPFLPDQTGHVAGADGKWYDTDGNGYAPADIPSNKAMTYTAVAPKTAFAVYSADDNSLNFYKRAGMPSAGEQFEGKTATAVYTGIETDTYTGNWQSNVPQNPASYSDTSPWAAYKSTIKTITAVDKIQPKSLDFWFSNPKSWATASAVTSADLSNIDTSKITSMSNLFTGCSNLTSLNISNWNISNVTNMTNMFSVYSGMFRTQPACSSLTTLDLSNWDTSNVTSMSGIFNGMTHLQQVTFGSNWKWVGTNGYLPTPSSTYITGADGKWYDTDSNGYAPADVPSNKAMTYYASKDLLPKAFAVYSYDDQSLSFYKRSAVPAAGEQFNGKTATAVYTGIEDTNGSKPRWSVYIGRIKAATVVDNGIRPKSTAYWFDGCNLMTQCDMSKLETSDLADASHMFYRCDSLTTIGDLSGWDVSNLTNASYMFRDCRSLTTLGDLSGWDVSKVTYASYMFQDCYKLTTLGDLSGWNTSSLTNASSMFSYCSRLSVNCSNWDVSKVTNHSNFNTNAPGVILPSAWQTSSDEGIEDSAIAPLCEEQGNGDVPGVASENGNDKDASKTDGEASADSETEGSNTASATDEAGAKEEEASGDIVQEETAAA